MTETRTNRFRRADGLCTVYALACGHLNAHTWGQSPDARESVLPAKEN